MEAIRHLNSIDIRDTPPKLFQNDLSRRTQHVKIGNFVGSGL